MMKIIRRWLDNNKIDYKIRGDIIINYLAEPVKIEMNVVHKSYLVFYKGALFFESTNQKEVIEAVKELLLGTVTK